MKNKSKVKLLSQKLKNLRIEEKKNQVIQKEIEERIVSLNKSEESSSKEEESIHKPAALTKVFRDRNSTVLKIGDKVNFLTPSKFRSTKGHVKYFTAQRVSVEDHRGIKISRAARNLLIVEK